MSNSESNGRVYLIGAGPGDPKLLTLRGAEILAGTDVVVYDRLVHPAILRRANPEAELIYVGKVSSSHTMSQEEISRLLVERAKAGKSVARLKGGDPFVFGRGGEEAESLVAEGIAFEVVPGVTSAVAVPAYAGIPVTHRKLCSALSIITGHESAEKAESTLKWNSIATGGDTLVFLMGVENLPGIVSELITNGRSADTPAAIIRWGTRSNQETIVGTLGTISEQAKTAGITSPAITVVGDVVKLREKLRWFDTRPLFGKKIIVTRSRDQASALTEKLEALGAEVVEFPVIKIVPPTDTTSLDLAIRILGAFKWIIFTSANGVEWFIRRLREQGEDVRAMAGTRLAAIGPATAAALERYGLRVEYVPPEYIAESVAENLPGKLAGRRVLIVRAKEAREALPERLTERGAEVEVAVAYETVTEQSDAAVVRSMIEAGEIDAVTFTSSSTVLNFIGLLGGLRLPSGVTAACIGPITAETARSLGIEPHIIAEDYTIDGLVKEILKHGLGRLEE